MGLAMPNLNLLMSMGTILLLFFWFIDPGLKKALHTLRSNKIALMMIGLYLTHVIWLVNTENVDQGLKDLRIKLPLLVFALVLGSTGFSSKQIKLFFLSLSMGIWIATIIGYYNYFYSGVGVDDYRGIVAGISHIRLSLFIVALAIGIVYFWKSVSTPWKIYCGIVILNMLLFLNILQAVTGLIGLFLLFCFSVIYFFLPKKRILVGGLFLVIGVISGLVLFERTSDYYQSYFSSDEDLNNLESYTVNGNPYYHIKDSKIVENGHYTFIYVCEPELVKSWNSRSELKLESEYEDSDLRARIGRYVTSRGLRKDSAGIASLTDEDISMIERGYPSRAYAEKSGVGLRYHSFLFAYHVFRSSGYASGYSFFQRIVYWEIATQLIKENFWLGVGTGDVKDAFNMKYESGAFNLDRAYWLRAHNQFLTFFISFGIVGFLFFVVFFFVGTIEMRTSFIGLALFGLALLSCLTEDTLETQAGVTFFAFFLGMFSKHLDDSK